jgi:hypothetical protein
LTRQEAKLDFSYDSHRISRPQAARIEAFRSGTPAFFGLFDQVGTRKIGTLFPLRFTSPAGQITALSF